MIISIAIIFTVTTIKSAFFFFIFLRRFFHKFTPLLISLSDSIKNEQDLKRLLSLLSQGLLALLGFSNTEALPPAKERF
jgi:hypothetical protein